MHSHCLVRVRLLHCMRVRLCNGYTWTYVQIMQHSHMHKTVTGCVEAKKLLSRRRQLNYTLLFFCLFSHTNVGAVREYCFGKFSVSLLTSYTGFQCWYSRGKWVQQHNTAKFRKKKKRQNLLCVMHFLQVEYTLTMCNFLTVFFFFFFLNFYMYSFLPQKK